MRRALGVLLGLAIASQAHAQLLSPGALTKPHTELEGIRNCTKCHEAGEQLSPERCLECHGEIARRIQKKTGFHARIPEADRACQKCHRDHAGLSASIIEWGLGGAKGFDHARAGWPLKGKHRTARCDQCHDRRLISARDVREILAKHPQKETYLGAPTTCRPCHFDEHRGQLDEQCEGCHDEKAWKPAGGFDHQEDSDYPLTGKHAKVACAKCHPSERDDTTPASTFPTPVGRQFARMKPVEHDRCSTCHEDPHQGRFGARCEDCHNTTAWTSMNAKAENDVSFHEKTRYPLRGEHRDVACKACHGPSPGRRAVFKGLRFDRCTSCHLDAHVGTLRKQEDCARCHGVEGFAPARFEAKDHAQTRYALEGGHVATPCRSCHPKDPALAARVPAAERRDLERRGRPIKVSLARFRVEGALDRCESCHRDVHEGQFAHRADKGDCRACHATSGFHPARLDHAKDTRYPLVGQHARVACGDCHLKATPTAAVRYRPVPTDCVSCHADVHQGQLEGPPSGTPADFVVPASCERCHTSEAWKQTLFVHGDARWTTYALEGKHADLSCASCHKQMEAQGGRVSWYRGLPRDCAGCHYDVHEGGMQRYLR